MRIEFDANSPTELSAVFVAIAVLRGGDLSLPLLDEINDVMPPAPVVGGHPTSGFGSAPVAGVPLPLAAAPVAATPLPPSPALSPVVQSGVDTDADGLPWDNRIHSTPASKKKDGKWRGKRGLDDATRDAVTAQLKQVMAAPAPIASPVPPPMFEESAAGVPLPPPSEPPVDAATAFGAAGATPVPSAPPAPPAPPPPAPPAPPAEAAPVNDFAGLMRKITGLQSAGLLTVEGTTQIAVSLGITGVRDLMSRPDLIPSFDALLPVAG